MGNSVGADEYKPSKDKTWKAYCAIDVGAVSCGYAYSFDDIKHTWMNKNWAESLGYFSPRAPSALLYDRSGKAVAFGFDACERFMSMSKAESEHARFHYDGLLNVSNGDIGLSTYKGSEDSDSDYSDDAEDESQGDETLHSSRKGKKLPVCALGCRSSVALLLAKHCKEEIEAKYSYYKKTPDEFVWAIVVPFTWDIAEKKKFREKIETDFHTHFSKQFDDKKYKIELVTSTEALWLASCDQVHEKLETSKRLFKKDSKKGEKAVILVHSGGTMTEISIHKKETGALPVEIVSIPIGGRYVNNLFEQFMERSLKFEGEKFIKECKRDYKAAWLDLMLKFEIARKAVHYVEAGLGKKASVEENDVSIDVNYGLSESHKNITGKRLTEALNQSEDASQKKVALSKSGKLIINGATTSHMCTNVMTLIFEELKKLMETKDLRFRGILMTGGFGESKFAREYLCKRQEVKEIETVTLYTPDNSSTLLAIGAIACAKQKHELGHTVAVLYHSQSDEEKLYPIMTKGEEIEVGQSEKFGPFRYKTHEDGQIHFDVYYLSHAMNKIRNKQFYTPSEHTDRTKINTLVLNVPVRFHKYVLDVYIEIIKDFKEFELTLTVQNIVGRVSLKLDYMPDIWVKRTKSKLNLSTQERMHSQAPQEISSSSEESNANPQPTTDVESLGPYNQSYVSAVRGSQKR